MLKSAFFTSCYVGRNLGENGSKSDHGDYYYLFDYFIAPMGRQSTLYKNMNQSVVQEDIHVVYIITKAKGISRRHTCAVYNNINQSVFQDDMHVLYIIT